MPEGSAADAACAAVSAAQLATRPGSASTWWVIALHSNSSAPQRRSVPRAATPCAPPAPPASALQRGARTGRNLGVGRPAAQRRAQPLDAAGREQFADDGGVAVGGEIAQARHARPLHALARGAPAHERDRLRRLGGWERRRAVGGRHADGGVQRRPQEGARASAAAPSRVG